MAGRAGDFEYVERKIKHLKRVGLVSNKATGRGFNGGACPDWLLSEQKDRREKRARNQARDFAARFAD